METYEFDEATEKKIEQFEKSLEDVQADISKFPSWLSRVT